MTKQTFTFADGVREIRVTYADGKREEDVVVSQRPLGTVTVDLADEPSDPIRSYKDDEQVTNVLDVGELDDSGRNVGNHWPLVARARNVAGKQYLVIETEDDEGVIEQWFDRAGAAQIVLGIVSWLEATNDES